MNIEYSGRVFSELGAAKAWGLTPDHWYREPRWSRIAMMAYARTRGAIDYWLAKDQADKLARESK